MVSTFAATSFAKQSIEPPYRVELAGRLGFGVVKIFGSNESDGGMNPGVAVELRVHRRFGLEFEADKMLNLDPPPVPCGLLVPCVGSAVEGTRSVFHYSGNFLFYFGQSGSLEPYVLGGVGGLRSRTAEAITFVGPTQGRIEQQPDRIDHGLSIGFGGGIRIRVGQRISLRPEFRLYDSSIRSRANLSLIQWAVLIGYKW
jgi:hypothetical protein